MQPSRNIAPTSLQHIAPMALPRLPENWQVQCKHRLRLMVLGLGLPASVQAHQTRLIRQRLLALALAFGLLAALWGPIDVAYLAPSDYRRVLSLRLAVVVALWATAWGLWREWPPLTPARALAGVVVAQCLGFAGMTLALSPQTPALLLAAYGFFPFVVVAQIALFPLPVLRSVALATPVLAVHMALWPAGGGAMPWLHALWLLGLIFGLAAWAAAMQLALLADLLSARDDAAHDALTGMANRRAAMARLRADVARAQRSGEALSVLSFDLDHFKLVNDRYGHAGGDEVLVKLAQVVGEQLRASDLAARMGGEEFLVILPNADAAQAAHVAERMRERIAQARVPQRSTEPICFTASVGVATLGPQEDASALLERADAALYQAKNTGRNRVCVAPSGASAAEVVG